MPGSAIARNWWDAFGALVVKSLSDPKASVVWTRTANVVNAVLTRLLKTFQTGGLNIAPDMSHDPRRKFNHHFFDHGEDYESDLRPTHQDVPQRHWR